MENLFIYNQCTYYKEGVAFISHHKSHEISEPASEISGIRSKHK